MSVQGNERKVLKVQTLGVSVVEMHSETPDRERRHRDYRCACEQITFTHKESHRAPKLPVCIHHATKGNNYKGGGVGGGGEVTTGHFGAACAGGGMPGRRRRENQVTSQRNER